MKDERSPTHAERPEGGEGSRDSSLSSHSSLDHCQEPGQRGMFFMPAYVDGAWWRHPDGCVSTVLELATAEYTCKNIGASEGRREKKGEQK